MGAQGRRGMGCRARREVRRAGVVCEGESGVGRPDVLAYRPTTTSVIAAAPQTQGWIRVASPDKGKVGERWVVPCRQAAATGCQAGVR